MQDSDIAHRVFVSVNMSDTAEIIGQLQLADTAWELHFYSQTEVMQNLQIKWLCIQCHLILLL